MQKILIVEDDHLLMEVLHNQLVAEGYEVLQAFNGEEGLKLALEQHPDLMLLDLIMPKVDGITMLRELRKDTWGQTARVLMLTNLSDGINIHEGMQLQVLGYLVKKDWKLEDIVDKIKESLPTEN